MESPPIFNSVEEECCFWKEKALRYYQEKIDSQAELEDFTEESRQLEAELEATIEQNENIIKTLRGNLNQIQIENESHRKKLLHYENETNVLDQQNKALQKERDNLKMYIRELEQKNDDLERANRIVSESVEGIETMLNQAYEKNALLEMEIDEKEAMQVKLQRLMDETRDLKQELNIKNRSSTCLDNSTALNNNSMDTSRIEMNDTCTTAPLMNGLSTKQQLHTSSSPQLNSLSTTMMIAQQQLQNGTTVTPPLTNGGNPIKHNSEYIGNSNSNIMTPSAKIQALNIVADLLRRVNRLIEAYDESVRTYYANKKPNDLTDS